jgi:release factor glutamine methyltransferase
MEPNFSEPSLPADIRNYAVQQISSIYDTRESLSMVHWLMEAILDLNRNKLLVNDPIMLDKKAWQVFKNALIRLKKNEPIQYILQEAYFFGRRFKVKPGVLVPRPETEELVHWISQNLVKDATIIDIGTGSGCIPVTLKLEKPDWQVHAMDISKIAIDVAKENSEALHSDITFHQTDILKMPDLGLQFDIIVSNPPTILHCIFIFTYYNTTTNHCNTTIIIYSIFIYHKIILIILSYNFIY